MEMPISPLDDTAQYFLKPDGATTLAFVQQVIGETTTPSWINSVPLDYGEDRAGTIKADEWRTLATVYLPIALVLRWGMQNHGAPADESSALVMLDHTMALFQAVTIVCCYNMTGERIAAYRDLVIQWVSGLSKYHHIKKHKKRPNAHAAIHVYDFLRFFGPVISWWCFPFERLIGSLQKVWTNDHVGGKLLCFLGVKCV